jgi:hypothetical protein
MINIGKRTALLVLVVGLIAIAMGGLFVGLGFQKAAMITNAMVDQNIKYSGAGGSIVDIIDTPQEAQVMADVLAEHQKSYGSYSDLAKDDPNRQTILNAMTMQDSLNLAVMGFGLTDVVKATGGFMILTGLTFALISIPGLRRKRLLS